MNLHEMLSFLKYVVISLNILILSLTWAFLDTECSICVLRIEVVLQLEGGWIVHEGLWTLCNTCSTVIEIHAGLQHSRYYFHLHTIFITLKMNHCCNSSVRLYFSFNIHQFYKDFKLWWFLRYSCFLNINQTFIFSCQWL
jgi:hypothetical protein